MTPAEPDPGDANVDAPAGPVETGQPVTIQPVDADNPPLDAPVEAGPPAEWDGTGSPPPVDADPTTPDPAGPSSGPDGTGSPQPVTGPDDPQLDVPPDAVQDPEAGTVNGGVTSTNVHESVHVRLRDVLALVENFVARNPHVQNLEADLKSAISTVERFTV